MVTDLFDMVRSWTETLSLSIGSALAAVLLVLPHASTAQTAPSTNQTSIATSSPTPTPTKPDPAQAPLTDREREMLALIKSLQDRVTKLESAQQPAGSQLPVADSIAGPTVAPAPSNVADKGDPADAAEAP